MLQRKPVPATLVLYLFCVKCQDASARHRRDNFGIVLVFAKELESTAELVSGMSVMSCKWQNTRIMGSYYFYVKPTWTVVSPSVASGHPVILMTSFFYSVHVNLIKHLASRKTQLRASSRVQGIISKFIEHSSTRRIGSPNHAEQLCWPTFLLQVNHLGQKSSRLRVTVLCFTLPKMLIT